MNKLSTYLTVLLLVNCILIPLSCNSRQDSNQPVIGEFSALELKEDLDQLISALKSYHSGLYWYQSEADFNTRIRQLENQIQNPADLIDFYRMITRLLVPVGCGHTRVRLPADRRQQMIDTLHVLPFELELYDGQLVITNNYGNTIIPTGSIIKSIDGNTTEEILKKLREHIPSDGYNVTGKDYSINRSAQVIISTLFNVNKNNFSVTFNHPEKENVQTQSFGLIPFNSRPQDQTEQPPLLDYRLINDSTGYLAIRTFGGSYLSNNGYDYFEFLENSFGSLSANKIQNLIIDVRGNGGGNDGYGSKLLSYLTSANFPYYRSLEVTSEYTGWGNIKQKADGKFYVTTHDDLKIHKPSRSNFEGRLYILIDGGSFSATSEFAAMAQDLDLATFIGTETGGGACGNTSGSSQNLQLKNTGISVNIPQWNYRVAIDENIPCGRGVMPDISIENSPLTDQDEILEKALSLIVN